MLVDKKVLVACEESQAVTIELRKLNIIAFSCDLIPCSGGYPEWHIQNDVLEIINDKWDMILAFPPCTYLTVSGNRWFNIERYGQKAIERHEKRELAISFFMKLVNAKIPKIAIENPVGIMSTRYRKPDQIIQPWHFGHGETKKTCLWLKGLPLLNYTNIVDGREQKIWKMTPSKNRAKLRSKTYKGIAQAMAKQWGGLLC